MDSTQIMANKMKLNAVGDIIDAVTALLNRFAAPGKFDHLKKGKKIDILYSKVNRDLVRFNGVTEDDCNWIIDFSFDEFQENPEIYSNNMVLNLMAVLEDHRKKRSPLILP